MLEHAQADLEVVLGRDADTVRAEWTIRQDQTRPPVATLGLRRDGLVVSKDFTLNDLRDADRLRDRLRQVWGDLLHSEIEKIGDELKMIFRSEGVVL